MRSQQLLYSLHDLLTHSPRSASIWGAASYVTPQPLVRTKHEQPVVAAAFERNNLLQLLGTRTTPVTLCVYDNRCCCGYDGEDEEQDCASSLSSP